MRIRDDIRLGRLQVEFNMRFPYLNLAFYAKPHLENMEGFPGHELSPDQLIGTVRKCTATGHFQLDENQLTGDFERMLRDVYGLHVQVLRRSGSKWVQSWASNSWTLGEQNYRGKLASGSNVRQANRLLDLT